MTCPPDIVDGVLRLIEGECQRNRDYALLVQRELRKAQPAVAPCNTGRDLLLASPPAPPLIPAAPQGVRG